MSQVDLVINEMGGPLKASWELSKLVGRPVGYSAVQNWRKRGIPLTWRSIISMNADTLGIKDELALEYLQPK